MPIAVGDIQQNTWYSNFLPTTPLYVLSKIFFIILYKYFLPQTFFLLLLLLDWMLTDNKRPSLSRRKFYTVILLRNIFLYSLIVFNCNYITSLTLTSSIILRHKSLVMAIVGDTLNLHCLPIERKLCLHSI